MGLLVYQNFKDNRGLNIQFFKVVGSLQIEKESKSCPLSAFSVNLFETT